MEEKKRALPFSRKTIRGSLKHTTVNTLWGITSSGESQASTDLSALTGRQVTVSESHPNWRKLRADAGDVGGEFFTQKRYVLGELPRLQMSGEQFANPNLIKWTYYGPVLPWNLAPGSIQWPPYVPSSDEELNEAGATAIARCKPTNSPADLSVALAELVREGLPKALGSLFWRDKTLSARNAGGEYLNYEFGWKPMVSDILNTAKAVIDADRIIYQYRRDAGRVVRRRYEFPIESDSDITLYMSNVNVHCAPSGYNMFRSGSPTGKVMRYRETTRRRWFSGAFTYYLPDANHASWLNAPAEARHLLGLSLTPDTIWNLSPWSWAIDWFTNAGDVISNFSDFAVDGLVLRYGYIMEHTVTKDTYVFEGDTGLTGPTRPPSLTLVSETKIRKRANPFGFGVTWDGLTNRQNAILAALGLSRKQ